MALRNSMELKSARYKLQAEKRRQTLSAWTYIPSLDVNYSDSRTVYYKDVDNGTINFTSTLSVPVSQGGRLQKQKELQRLALDIQNILLSQNENEIRDTCYSVFHKTHILQLKLKSLKEVEHIAKSHYIIAQKEFELGRISEIELVETHLNISTLSQQIHSTETDLIQTEYSLKKIIGIDNNVPIEPVSKINETYIGVNLTQYTDRLKTIAVQKNIDLLQSRFSVEQYRVNNLIADSSWIPNISLQGTFQLSGESYPLQYPNYGIRVNFEFPSEIMPFDFSIGISTTPDTQYGRSFSSGVKSPDSLDSIIDRQLTRLSYLLALEQNRAATKDVMFSIDQLIMNYERAREEQKLMIEEMNIQTRKNNILRKQMEIGQITRLEYLEGENELVATRLEILTGVLSIILLEQEIERTAGLLSGSIENFKVKTND